MHKSYSKIVEASTYRDVNSIQGIIMDLMTEKMKMDKFFSMFLEKCGGKMDPEKTDTPIWKLYRSKTKEYSDINQALKAAEYYLKKNTNYV